MEHNFETLEDCPSCNHKSFTPYLTCKDYTYSQEEFQIQQCDNCKLLFTNPRPDNQSISKYYDNPEYVSHTDTKEGLIFSIYGAVKRFSLKQKRRLLEAKTIDKTVLDYGAGSGDFSNELASNGWDVTSYEPNNKARLLIQQKNTSVKIISSLSDLSSSSISVITLWHVLEHVHNLKETLLEFERILRPGGTLVIAVPNDASFDARFYREDWAAYDVPRHLYHFNPNSLNPLLSRIGFSISEMKPLWFDSTYVSLLSEKNKKTNAFVGWVRALIVGQLSNLQTLSNTQKCSSITYVYKKPI